MLARITQIGSRQISQSLNEPVVDLMFRPSLLILSQEFCDPADKGLLF